MPITHQPGTTLAFQQQFRPIGRIRTGQQVEYERGGRRGKRPARLETFRLTSSDAKMLQRAASVYGGVVEEWPEAPDGDALQLVTEARELDVLVPGGQPLSQWMEMWGSGGCLRRCTGEEETLSGGPCKCPVDPTDRTELATKGEACKPTTRLNLLLPDMDVGAWLLVSHSYYAAVELPPVVTLLADFASRMHRPVPAKLWIDQRRIKRPNQPPKEFSVPALRTPITWAGLLASGEIAELPALPSQTERVTATLPTGETPLPDDPQPTTPPPPAKPAPSKAAPAVDPPKAARPAHPTEEPEAPPDAWAPAPEPAPVTPEAPPVPDEHHLVAQIRSTIAAGTATGQMTPEQKQAVFERIMTPVGAAPFRIVVTRAIGSDAFNKPSAREAAGLLAVADQFVDQAELVEIWRSAAKVIAGPPT
jgi:hypothetical protein